MRLRWLGSACFLLAVLMLNVEPAPGQPGGKGSKGSRGGFPGGGAAPTPGGGAPSAPGGTTPGGFPGGGGFPGRTPGGGFPGGGGTTPGGGPPGGGFGRAPDPERAFSFYSQNTDVIDLGKMTPDMRNIARRGLERSGLTNLPDNAVITKPQFVEAYNRAQAARATTPGGPPPGGFGGPPGGGTTFQVQPGGGMPPGGFGSRGPGGPGGPGGGPGGPGGGPGGPGGSRGMSPEEIERRFHEYDANRDGKVSFDELSDRSSLKGSFKDFDTNKDGYIDLAEYKAYIAVRLGGTPGDPSATPGGPGYVPGGPPDGRRDGRPPEAVIPVAIRFGKLPQGLPDWFVEYDTDKDGQVGLYEWRAAGKDMKEFLTMDLDGDGLLAPQELIRYTAIKADQDKLVAAEEGIEAPKTGTRGSGGSRGFGGPGGFGGGKGGDRGSGGPGGGFGSKGGDRSSDTKSDKKDEKGGSRGPWGGSTGGKK
jgi:Ca2+-binding EF-hand superfamily protein